MYYTAGSQQETDAFGDAIVDNDSVTCVKTMKDILECNPGFDLNKIFKGVEETDTAGIHQVSWLHLAVYYGNVEAVEFLLTQPAIDPNVVTATNATALSWTFLSKIMATKTQLRQIRKLFLENKRVDTQIPDCTGMTPFAYAVVYEELKTLIQFIAYRDFHDLNPFNKGEHGGFHETVLRYPSLKKLNALEFILTRTMDLIKQDKIDVLVLVKKLYDLPLVTRHFCRMESMCVDSMVADTFSLVIFVCDKLLVTKKIVDETTFRQQKAMRFFTITSLLPIELQMVICNRLHNLMKIDIVLTSVSNGAFHSLAREFQSVVP